MSVRLYCFGKAIQLMSILWLRAGVPLPRSTSINPLADHLSFQADAELTQIEAHLNELGIHFVRQKVKEGDIIVDQLFFHGPDNEMIEICNCECLPVHPIAYPMGEAPLPAESKMFSVEEWSHSPRHADSELSDYSRETVEKLTCG